MLSQQIRKCYYETLGTGVLNSKQPNAPSIYGNMYNDLCFVIKARQLNIDINKINFRFLNLKVENPEILKPKEILPQDFLFRRMF